MPTFPYFLDIETVPIKTESDIDDRTWEIFMKKFSKEIAERNSIDSPGDLWNEKAGMFAEFAKIICVCIGVVTADRTLRIRTLAYEGPDAEKRILVELKKVLEKAPYLCAHNGFEFDFPFLQRRYMIHDIDLPDTLNTMGKKPWDVLHKDTMKMWGFGQFNHKSSLDAIANCFGIPSPKADMDGSKVAQLYYTPVPEGVLPWDHMEPILKRIGAYCAGDIVTLANVYMRLEREPMITPDKIVYVEEPKPAQQSLNI